ncbi:MAG: hypothetical protein HYW27_04200 [Candidatus Aenigmarchaeota archaeon]|nr:hypothetical protein [Candidatus Aenigmarchaeota archaeon]
MNDDDIRKRKKEGWIEASFAIEVLAIKEDVAKESLSKLVEEMKEVRGAYVYESGFSDIAKVKAPLKGVEEAYSQIATVKLFSKDVMTLVSLAITFGPSSIEIMGPSEKNISVSELQNMMNLISGIIHQFAAAGMGGIVISPEKNRR